MLGAIIGDTVGSVYEFHNIKTTEFKLFTAENDYTDDSVMTFAVADWLLNDKSHSEKALVDTFFFLHTSTLAPRVDMVEAFICGLFIPIGNLKRLFKLMVPNVQLCANTETPITAGAMVRR